MSDHASMLELDEAAAGLAGDSVRAHVAGCPECGARASALAAEGAQLRADPRYRQTLARLPAAPPRPRLAWWIPVGAAVAAAGALLFILRPAAPGELRAKGGASLALVGADGRATAAPRVGEQVELRFSPGAHRYALVAAVDEAGVAAPLWPAGGGRSGAIAPGGRAALSLRVTPGKVRVVAVFSDGPLALAEAIGKPLPAGAESRELEVGPPP